MLGFRTTAEGSYTEYPLFQKRRRENRTLTSEQKQIKRDRLHSFRSGRDKITLFQKQSHISRTTTEETFTMFQKAEP